LKLLKDKNENGKTITSEFMQMAMVIYELKK